MLAPTRTPLEVEGLEDPTREDPPEANVESNPSNAAGLGTSGTAALDDVEREPEGGCVFPIVWRVDYRSN